MLIYDTFPALTFLALMLHICAGDIGRHSLRLFLFESNAVFQFTMTNNIVVNKNVVKIVSFPMRKSQRIILYHQ